MSSKLFFFFAHLLPQSRRNEIKFLNDTKQHEKRMTEKDFRPVTIETRSNRSLGECVRFACLLGVQVAVDGKGGWFLR